MSFSLTGGLPLFPSLTPRVVDPLYKLDVAKNEDAELVCLEKEHENFVKSIKEKDCHLTPIGKDLFECFLSYHSFSLKFVMLILLSSVFSLESF